jgi:hypothetical protein
MQAGGGAGGPDAAPDAGGAPAPAEDGDTGGSDDKAEEAKEDAAEPAKKSEGGEKEASLKKPSKQDLIKTAQAIKAAVAQAKNARRK